jgi:Fur family ferric uptake transcriptional regulator
VTTRTVERNPKSWRWFWDALDAYLARQGLKQTRQRKQIVELFLDAKDHLSAEELHESARKAGHDVGLATIYRTLNLLAEAGLATQKSFGESRQVFEVNEPGTHHDHIICVVCGTVTEFENDEIERLQERIAEELGFELTGHRLDLWGRCRRPDCKPREKAVSN